MKKGKKISDEEFLELMKQSGIEFTIDDEKAENKHELLVELDDGSTVPLLEWNPFNAPSYAPPKSHMSPKSQRKFRKRIK